MKRSAGANLLTSRPQTPPLSVTGYLISACVQLFEALFQVLKLSLTRAKSF